MPPRKRRRTRAATTVPTPALPANLLLEITARSDARTIFRCAATCKPLRRAILSPGFVRRVTHHQGRGWPDDDAVAMPSSILGALGETFSYVHPVATASWDLERHLAPYVSLRAARLLEDYAPLASRRGFVVLGRRRRRPERSRSDLCVYDPLTNDRTFFPAPPDVGQDPYHGLRCYITVFIRYVLLTAADGIGGGFMLLAADMTKDLDLDCSPRIRVQTVSSSSGAGREWAPVKAADADHQCPWWCTSLDSYNDDAVVIGGIVHCLMHAGDSFVSNDGAAGEYILTYDVNAGTVGSVDLPGDRHHGNAMRGFSSRSQLLASPDGTKLSLVAVDGLVLSIWVLSPSSPGGSTSWARHAVVVMEATWPWDFQPWEERGIRLANFGDQRSGVVFLRCGVGQGLLYGFVMETKVAFYQTLDVDEDTGIPYEVDLASRLSSMKAF